MFLLARFVTGTFAAFVWRWTRRSAWWMKNLPWIRIVAVLTAVGMLISVVLEIVIKVHTLRARSGGAP